MTTRPPTLLATLGAAVASPASDAELLGRFLAGQDDAAFAALMRRYARLVWRVARTRCRTDATAEDVFQAAFVVLARKAGSIRSGGALPGWLHRTAHRLAVKATRSERPAVPLRADTPVSADPLDALSARELLAAMDDELTKLSDAERSVLVLCGIDNLSLDEAAARLGWTRNSAKGRLERARAKLRTRLDARGLTLPAVVLALVGGPSAATVQAASQAAAGGPVPPAVEQLLPEGLNVKGTITKATVAVALLGAVLTLGGPGGGPTPAITAAPVPKAVKPPSPSEAWGEEIDGLQAGLRMPGGATLRPGEAANLQVVVRNVSERLIEVTYTEAQVGVSVHGKNDGGTVELSWSVYVNGRLPEPRVQRLEPQAELVRWTIRVRHSPGDDKTPPGSRVDLGAGKYQFVMKPIGGDLLGVNKLGGIGLGDLPALDRIGTGTLEVTFADPADLRKISTRAPVPKDKTKLVLWSEPVKVDWQASRAERLPGIWMPDGKSVLVPAPTVATKDESLDFGGVDLRNADTGKVTKTLAFKNGKLDQLFQPMSLAMTADGKTVYASGSLFAPGGKGEAARGRVTWRDTGKDDPPEVASSATSPEDPIALSAEGKQLAALAGDSLEVLDTPTGKLLWVSKLGGRGRGRLTAVTFNAPDRTMAVGTSTGEWIAIDAKSGRTLSAVTDLGVKVRVVATSADGKNLAFGGEGFKDGQPLVVFAARAVHKIADAVPEKEVIDGLAFSPDGKHLATACSDGFVRVFETEKGKLVASTKEHKEAVFSVAYSPDGTKLLTVGRDAVKVWDVELLMKAK